MQLRISDKHLQIDKAQSVILGTIAAATIISVFCLASSKALLSQAAYQRRVLQARNEAVVQIDKNAKSAATLVNQYQTVFEGDDSVNLIGGKKTKDNNAKPPDGDNARIVLNALPTSYDFPALLTSVSVIMQSYGISNPSIQGTDVSPTVDNQPSPSPEATPIPLTISGAVSYDNSAKLLKDFERSIRPFDVTQLTLAASTDSTMTVTATLNTYYQPAKALTIGTKEIK